MIESVAFDESGAFEAEVEDAADLRFTTLNVERPSWSLRKISLPDSTHIQIGSEGSGSIMEGAIQQEGFVVFLQEPGAIAYANGVPWASNSAFLMPPGAEFCIRNRASNGWLSVFVPNERSRSADPTEISHSSAAAAARMVRDETNAATELWAIIERFSACVIREPCTLREQASLAAFSEAISTCILRLCGQSDRQSTPSGGRPAVIDLRLVKSAVELIEDRLPVTASMQDLVAATGVSESALRRGFNKYYGVSPAKFMLLRRLRLARRRLCDCGSNGVTVTEVAASLGMWDFGRFADRYHRAFGEYPSETLRRARK